LGRVPISFALWKAKETKDLYRAFCDAFGGFLRRLEHKMLAKFHDEDTPLANPLVYNSRATERLCFVRLGALRNRLTPMPVIHVSLVVALAWLALAIQAHSAPTIGETTFEGKGCPPGKASATVSPDRIGALSIIFNIFTADAGKPMTMRRAKIVCTVSIPLTFANAKEPLAFKLSYRVFPALTNDAHAELKLRYQIIHAGKKLHGPVFQYHSNGPVQDDALYTHTVRQLTPSSGWSSNVILRAKIDIDVIANQQMDQAKFVVDSIDVTPIEK